MRTIKSNPRPGLGKLVLLAQTGDGRGQGASGKEIASTYTSVGNGIHSRGYSGSRPFVRMSRYLHQGERETCHVQRAILGPASRSLMIPHHR